MNIIANTPLVSVILPTYNGGATLVDAVRSILRQTWSNFELIIVDDASTQDIPLALAEFSSSPLLRIVRNRVNSGLSASLNAGIAASSGEFIARMDDDDFSLPARLAEQVYLLQARPEIDVVGTGVAFYDRDQNYLRDHLFPSEHAEILHFMRRGNPLAHPTVMFRRTFIERAGGYDESLRRMEDLELWGRMADTCRYANIPLVLLRHRVRPAKTLSAVPPGIRIRLLNGWRLGYLHSAIPWTLLYVLIEVFRHWGYRQRAFHPSNADLPQPGFTD